MRIARIRVAGMGLAGIVLSIGSFAAALPAAQSITVDTVDMVALQLPARKASGASASKPANFQEFEAAVAGEYTMPKTLTLHFSKADALLDLKSTADFKIENGGTCLKGDVYPAKSSCTLVVRFTPQSAGHRLGKLTIQHSASVAPFSLGVGGYAYAPIVSFIPSQLAHVTGTYPNNVGLLQGASSLTIDGGDTLYIADTGNNVVREIDSSGIFTVSSGTLSAPGGIAVDNFGEVFFTEPAQNALFEILDYGSQVSLGGAGSDNCTTTTTCNVNSEKLYLPGALAIDGNNNIFMAEELRGAAVLYAQPFVPQFARLFDPFTFQTAVTSYGFGVDQYDTIYSAWTITNVCEIVAQYFSDAASSRSVYNKIAGGRKCGFSGDGGLAGNAEIGTQIGQIVFDAAGNLYFSDTKNNRVRRIDAMTNIISTVAGSGAAGTPSDGNAATSSTLSAPTGLGVDSLGQVYIIASTTATGAAQSLRKVTNIGMAEFGSQQKGTSSAAKTVILSNTGNSALVFTKAVFTGSNGGDFSLDDSTTTCLLTPGSTLAAGESCVVGVLFKPASTGSRSAKLNFLDNTVPGTNTILLSGSGTLPAAKVAIVTPASGASVTSGTTVPFKVSVTSSSGSAPTGKVTFSVDGATFGTSVTLASGAASVNLTGLTTKTHTLAAAYSGDGNYAAATVSESLTVKAAVSKSDPPPVALPPVSKPPVHSPGPIPTDAAF